VKKIDVNNGYFLLLIIVLASIVLPVFSSPASIAGDVQESVTVYREGLFGPHIDRLTMADGGVMRAIVYPWYYFWEYTDKFTSMNIYGIGGSSSSNSVNYVVNSGEGKIPVVFKQQNDLDFSNSINWFFDTKEDCVESKLVAYDGLVLNSGDSLSTLTDGYNAVVINENGPWAYGQTWTSTLHITPSLDPGSYDYTVQETLYPSSLTGFDTDRAWVHVTVLEVPELATTGSITVKVLDNLVAHPCYVQMFKDGYPAVNQLYLNDGEHTFSNLEFGHSYSFTVIDSDYDTMYYDAFPQQTGYNYDTGNVELTKDRNTVSYIIYGTTPDSESGFDAGDGILPDYSDNPISKIIDSVTDDNDGGDPDYFGLIVKLMGSLGLMAIVILGIPLFMILAVIVLLIALLFRGAK
jgi:hypothetical protein